MKTNGKSVKSAKVGRKSTDTKVAVTVSADAENRTGLRGLKGLVFAEMAKAFSAKKPLPSMDDLTKEIEAKFPQSRWIARPKIHYSYYKSKFLQSVKVK